MELQKIVFNYIANHSKASKHKKTLLYSGLISRVVVSVCDSWHALRSCIVSSAETSIGRGKRSDPEWFTESSETLNPLIEAKNKAHLKFLQIGTRSCRQRF